MNFYQSVSGNGFVYVENLSGVEVLLLEDEEGRVGDGVGAHEDPNFDGRHLTKSGSCYWKENVILVLNLSYCFLRLKFFIACSKDNFILIVISTE